MKSWWSGILFVLALAAAGCVGAPVPSCVENEEVCAGSATCDATTGKCEAAIATSCAGFAVCGAGTTCDESTGRCVGGQIDCRVDTNPCIAGTSCDQSTGRCVLGEVDCREANRDPCGTGTVCDSSSGRCVADAADCRVEATLCGAGTSCDGATGRCTADAPDCHAAASLCGSGTSCDQASGQCLPLDDCSTASGVCGEGSVCGSDGFCRADCRLNLAGICGDGMLCNRGTGGCEGAQVLDCKAVPGLCWEDQQCDAPTGYCRESAIDLQQPYDVQVYDLKIDLLTATQSFEASLDVYFVATRATTRVELAVGKETTVAGASYSPYTITAVKDSAGTSLSFVQSASMGTLEVPLAKELVSGQGEVLTITYAGKFNPITDDGDPLFYAGLMQREGAKGNKMVMTFGWPDLTSRWMPSHDHPSDAARFIADVGIDNGYTVVSNGLRVSKKTVGGLQRSTFVLRQPVPTYALSITASNYVKVPIGVVDGVSVDAYVYPGNENIPTIWWSTTLGALKYLNSALGPYPFDTFGIVEFPSIFGGMEHATLVSISDAAVGSATRGARVIVHELVHHWFGDNARQNTWEAFWLNESLATFYDAEHRRISVGQVAYQDYLDSRRATMFRYPFVFDTHPLRYTGTSEVVPSFDDSTGNGPYFKGLWFWHMLRRQMDEATFATLMRTFYEETRLACYDTPFLLATVNNVTGKDFTGFFNEWVHQAGWPKLQYTWSHDATAETITVNVTQAQNVTAYGTYTFDGPLALKFKFDDDVASTPSCLVTVTMTGGATTASGTGACTYVPTAVATPFTSDLLVQML